MKYFDTGSLPVVKVSFPDADPTDAVVDEWLQEFARVYGMGKKFVLSIDTMNVNAPPGTFLQKMPGFLKRNRHLSEKFLCGVGVAVSSRLIKYAIDTLLLFYTPVSEVRVFNDFSECEDWVAEKAVSVEDELADEAPPAPALDWRKLISEKVEEMDTIARVSMRSIFDLGQSFLEEREDGGYERDVYELMCTGASDDGPEALAEYVNTCGEDRDRAVRCLMLLNMCELVRMVISENIDVANETAERICAASVYIGDALNNSSPDTDEFRFVETLTKQSTTSVSEILHLAKKK